MKSASSFQIPVNIFSELLTYFKKKKSSEGTGAERLEDVEALLTLRFYQKGSLSRTKH